MAGHQGSVERVLGFGNAVVVRIRRQVQKLYADGVARFSSRRTMERWSPSHFTEAAPELYWTSSRVVQGYLHELLSGDRSVSWAADVLRRHAGRGNARILVLGCGHGWLERVVAADSRVAQVVAVDLSPAAIREATRLAIEAELDSKIRYEVVDLDRDELPRGPFDIVMAHGAIHHVRNLEGLFDRLAVVLGETGVLAFCEYVGPRRFAFDRKRERLLDEYLQSIPEEYRRLPQTGGVAVRGHRTDPRRLALEDPSEAVRSDEIMPLVRSKLLVLEERPYGGSLLNPLLYEIIANFREGDEAGDAILRRLCAAERDLMRSGELPSDFMVVEAKRREAGEREPSNRP